MTATPHATSDVRPPVNAVAIAIPAIPTVTAIDDGGGVDALSADGGIIRIRPVQPLDAPGLTDLHERSSDETLYRRFLATGHHAIIAEVARLIRPASFDHVVLVAVERNRIIGVCSYEVLADHSEAEFAIFVDDTAHDRGVGTLLLEHLGVYARRRGVTDLLGEVLASNAPMLRVTSDLGQPLRAVYGDGLVHVHVATSAADSNAVDDRDLAAGRRSLAALFAPGCVAVVGAGRAPGGIGHTVLRAIVDGGFTGTVYAINPGADRIGGVSAYPTIAAAPQAPDLVVIAVPAVKVAAVLTQAATAGVRAAVVLSAGFGETGPDGHVLQAELVRIARAAGIRLVGPNCLGVLNTDPRVRLHATFGAAAVPGGLAVASQSGAVAVSLLAQTARAGLGVSSFVSLGNKADVSGNDVLSYWYDDPAVKVVALYLESLGNPRRFARIARAVGRRKPVLVVKSGRSVAGARAGASHTAAAAAPDATVDALFAQAGVIRCDGLRDLIDTARMLTDQPLPAGSRIAVVGNAGGINVLCADAADAAGLTLPPLPLEIQAAIRTMAPGVASVTNPVDLGAAATPASTRTAIQTIAPHVDAILVAIGATQAIDINLVIAEVAVAADTIDIPVAVVLLGVDDMPTSLGVRKAPVYPLPEDAIGAMARSIRYAMWRVAPAGRRSDLAGTDAPRARQIVAGALTASGGWQPPHLATEILNCYGIRTAIAREAATERTAVAAAQAVGFPVVVKSADPDLVHKSDIGGVKLGLADVFAVRAAYRDVVTATGDPRVLVQAQAPAGVELVTGIAHDPLFGSILMCGLGGIHTDLLRDRALRLLPVTDIDAAAMWRGLRAAALLTGYRGSPPVDTDAIEDLLLRLGRLAEDLPEVAELDLNPVIASVSGLAIVDVKLRLAAVSPEPDPGLRALREPALPPATAD